MAVSQEEVRAALLGLGAVQVGSLTIEGGVISNVTTPTEAGQAASKAYVDGVTQDEFDRAIRESEALAFFYE